jgi:hypothetical protein
MGIKRRRYKMTKIDCYYNKEYLFSTTQHKTIKELKEKMTREQGQKIVIASIPNKTHIIDAIEKYSFRIDKGR